MNKCIIMLLAGVLLAAKANSQITKGNWMVGGSGKFSIIKNKSDLGSSKSTFLTLSPDVGYFIINKLATGLNVVFSHEHVKYAPSVDFKYLNIGVGPFLRYYFLPTDNRINLLAQGAYQYAVYSSNSLGQPATPSSSSNDLLFTAGPVLYLNTSVGIELTANYELYKPSESMYANKTFYIALGFQIHLEKDNN